MILNYLKFSSFIMLRMSLNELVENIEMKNIQTPDELAVVNKWDILMLLIPGLTKDKVKTQKKELCPIKD